MFVNLLSAYGKYTFQYCENLQLPIQMQLSEKRKKFSQFFVPFLESRLHFGTKMMVIAHVFLKLETPENFVTPLCKKCFFGTCLDSQHVKVSRILADSA